ncbi:MAG: PspA/IM30 family protein [Gammaproteobacteria bacterium]|nr:PspA/IM30 family protein [Gammaproteobacteria bacterium]
MGIFSKARDVKDADIGEMLAKSGDPLKLVRVIISEMEDTLVEARSTAVRALARKKELERNAADRRAQAEDWAQKAEFALRKNREDLARGALGMKARALSELRELEQALPAAQAELDKLDADIAELRGKLTEARSRQRALILRGEAALSRHKIKRQLAAPRAAQALEALDDTERAVDRIEAEAEAYDLGDRTLEAEFARLETDSQVEAELAQLREKLKKPEDAGTPDNSKS